MFQKKSKVKSIIYDGAFVQTEQGYFFIVSSSKRYRILSERVLASWRPQRIISSSEAAVQRYLGHNRIAAKMRFRNGSLLHSLHDGIIYLIVNGERRPIVSPDVFAGINAKMSDVVTVSKSEILLHPLGDDIS